MGGSVVSMGGSFVSMGGSVVSTGGSFVSTYSLAPSVPPITGTLLNILILVLNNAIVAILAIVAVTHSY